MADSTADSEECGPDSNSRFMRNFKPLGHSFASVFAGAFDVRQELVECVAGTKAAIRMSFSPCDPKHELPTGSFLWVVEPDANGACWAEFINTPESRVREIPELKLETGKKHVFLLGHNQLNEKASRRIVEVLNGGDAVFADYAVADGIRFRPGKCAG